MVTGSSAVLTSDPWAMLRQGQLTAPIVETGYRPQAVRRLAIESVTVEDRFPATSLNLSTARPGRKPTSNGTVVTGHSTMLRRFGFG